MNWLHSTVVFVIIGFTVGCSAKHKNMDDKTMENNSIKPQSFDLSQSVDGKPPQMFGLWQSQCKYRYDDTYDGSEKLWTIQYIKFSKTSYHIYTTNFIDEKCKKRLKSEIPRNGSEAFKGEFETNYRFGQKVKSKQNTYFFDLDGIFNGKTIKRYGSAWYDGNILKFAEPENPLQTGESESTRILGEPESFFTRKILKPGEKI